MASRYVRAKNLALDRWTDSIGSVLVENRGVINELAFRLFAAGTASDICVRDLDARAVELQIEGSLDFIHRFREFSRAPVDRPSREAIEEAKLLAERLNGFVLTIGSDEVTTCPSFAGCGWVDACEGDLLLDGVLCEVKSGGKKFRGRDLRQVLTYAALNSVSPRYVIDSIGLVNPRLGLYFVEDLDVLCEELAGTSASEVLSEIVGYMSQPHWRDEAV
jgi:hypothetical protein